MTDTATSPTRIDDAAVPDDWTYDPGWTWYGVSAAIHDDGYPVAPEPDYDTRYGYLIEITDDQTEARLFRNDEADRHVRLDAVSLTDHSIAAALDQLATTARTDQPEEDA